MKLPIRSLGVLAAGLMIGTALAPVAAQQAQSGVDGQVAVRSDGAVYLITNGQRRWVATVVITDEEINAYPEGEPIYAGLAPIGSAQAAAPAAKPSTSTAPAASASPQPAAASAPSPAPAAAAKPTAPAPATPDPNLAAELPIQVDIDGSDKFEPGDSFRVEVKTRKDVVCELVVRMPDGSERAEDSKTAPTDGKCGYTVEIPNSMAVGDGMLRGSVREAGKVNTMELPFSVVPAN